MDLATTHDWREGAIVPEAESCADHAAFQAFVERNMSFAFRVAWALLRNRSDADDVVQECFWRLYRKRAWSDIENEQGYLARVVWRMARDRQRAQQERRVAWKWTPSQRQIIRLKQQPSPAAASRASTN
jgi:DNA-directed RNA polymerase specialized sigma24 family protein